MFQTPLKRKESTEWRLRVDLTSFGHKAIVGTMSNKWLVLNILKLYRYKNKSLGRLLSLEALYIRDLNPELSTMNEFRNKELIIKL